MKLFEGDFIQWEQPYKERSFIMTNLEMVEKIREKANVSYEEARNALEACNYDLLDAMVYLEKLGKIKSKDAGYSYTESTYDGGDAMYRDVEMTASGGRTEKKKKGAFIMDELKKLFDKSLKNSFRISKDDRVIVSVPVLVMVILVIGAFWVTVPLLIVGLVFRFRYSFEGQDLGNDTINGTMDKAADYVDDLVEKYKERKNNDEQ